MKKNIFHIFQFATNAIFPLYPFWINWGINRFSIYIVCIIACLFLLFRFLLTNNLSRSNIMIHIIPLIILGTALIMNSERLLWFYPVFMSIWMTVLFCTSLLQPISLIEKFARIKEPNLSEDGVKYCRLITKIWSFFLGLNSMIALGTVFWGDRKIWTLYNGLIFYLLFGLLIGGEFIYRHFFKGIQS